MLAPTSISYKIGLPKSLEKQMLSHSQRNSIYNRKSFFRCKLVNYSLNMFLIGFWNFEAELLETLGFKYGKTSEIFISNSFKNS